MMTDTRERSSPPHPPPPSGQLMSLSLSLSSSLPLINSSKQQVVDKSYSVIFRSVDDLSSVLFRSVDQYSLPQVCRSSYIKKYTAFYDDKTLDKNLDLTQDSPNKILFRFLWEHNLVQKSSKIFRWPEMYSLGKILGQDFQMAAVTKILMRRDKSIAPLLSMGDISNLHRRGTCLNAMKRFCICSL